MKDQFSFRGLAVAALLLTSAIAGIASAQAPTAVNPPGVIAVSPGKFEIEIGNRPAVESLRLFNLGDSEVEIEASVANWVLAEDNSVQVVEPTEQSLDQWIIINPVRFTIPARGSQTVRFAVRPRVAPTDGEHRAMIYFEEQLPTDRTPGEVYVNFKVGVAVYGNAGEVIRESTLNDVGVVADESVIVARYDVSSLGNAHVRLGGQYAIWSASSFPGAASMIPIADADEADTALPEGVLIAGVVPRMPVLAGTRRTVPVVVGHALQPGEYIFASLGDVSGEEFREAVRFVVPQRAGTAAGQQED